MVMELWIREMTTENRMKGTINILIKREIPQVLVSRLDLRDKEVQPRLSWGN
jgi:hypothetical protein